MKTLKSKPAIIIALIVIFSTGFNACKDNDDNEDVKIPGASEQDEDFAISASYVNLAEIRLGQLALQKSANDSVKAFAQNMVTDHTSAQNELRAISSNIGITLNDSIDQAHRTLFSRLSGMKGFAFDSAYINNQVLDHQTTKTLLETMIANRGDSSLLSYATKRLPIVNAHLQKAIDTRAKLTGAR